MIIYAALTCRYFLSKLLIAIYFGRIKTNLMNKKEKNINSKKLVNFFFEVLSLKMQPRSGFQRVGIRNPDSVAEHSFCATQIAYFLAKIEKADVLRVVLMTLFHDNGEARVGDSNWIQKVYMNSDKAESKAFFDQIKGLDGDNELKQIYSEYLEQKTKEAKIVNDADRLELALQAKVYLEQGNKIAKLWIENIRSLLKTKTAKDFLKIIERADFNEWWQGIGKIKKRIREIKRLSD